MDPMMTYNRKLREVETLRIVSKTSDENLEKIANQLNDYGIITDSDSPSFITQVMEYWTADCDRLLELKGYEGKGLSYFAKYYEDVGKCGALYDKERYSKGNGTLTSPQEYLDSKIKEYLNNLRSN